MQAMQAHNHEREYVVDERTPSRRAHGRMNRHSTSGARMESASASASASAQSQPAPQPIQPHPSLHPLRPPHIPSHAHPSVAPSHLALSPDESLRSLLRAAEGLGLLAASSRGPNGGAKLVHSNPRSPSIHLSSLSTTLLNSLSFGGGRRGSDDGRHVDAVTEGSQLCASILCKIVTGACEGLGDGGWSALALATGLMRKQLSAIENSQAGAEQPIPVSLLLAGHQLALKWCMDFLTADYPLRESARVKRQDTDTSGACVTPLSVNPHPVLTMKLSNLPILLTLIRSQLASKNPVLQLTNEERQHLSITITKAFLKGLHSHSFASSGPLSNIRIFDAPPAAHPRGYHGCSVMDGIILDVPLKTLVPLTHYCVIHRAMAEAKVMTRRVVV